MERGLKMDEAIANRIYDVLVEHAGAPEEGRESFVYHHVKEVWPPSTEWRFCGHLGFGGKFWVHHDDYTVTCYREDETPERMVIIENVNSLLKKLWESK